MNPSLKARRELVAERWCKRFNQGTKLHDCQELAEEIRALQEEMTRHVLTELGYIVREGGGWIRKFPGPVQSTVIPKAVWTKWIE